jgi:tetrahedral aminopeptidase
VGLPADEVAGLVRVGDLITFRARFTSLSGGYAFSKSFDDRAGVGSIAVCLDELSRRRHLWDVYGVATVQEELGMRGAITSAYGIDPTAAIAIDVTFGQQPGVGNAEAMKMDGGPCIAMGPNVHPKIFEKLVSTARSLEISHQIEVVPGASGTDAWAIQVTRSGVPTGLLSIPVRAMHTSVETVSLRDIERTGKLMAEFIARLDEQFAESLTTRDALAQAAGEPGNSAGGTAGGTAPRGGGAEHGAGGERT